MNCCYQNTQNHLHKNAEVRTHMHQNNLSSGYEICEKLSRIIQKNLTSRMSTLLCHSMSATQVAGMISNEIGTERKQTRQKSTITSILILS